MIDELLENSFRFVTFALPDPPPEKPDNEEEEEDDTTGSG